ncbi:hypothetical protein PENSPDRAFT_754921 [Peniophora sp. CONT]|nr:hypothetical protein PENSPDRAFT_754921 [Peniophora sp. CONT]
MSSPIHTLPAEIVSHVFRDLLEDYVEDAPIDITDLDSSASRREKLPPALLLRSVCLRWRAIAENTSELWPDIVGPYGLEWTRRALAWSKDCSLDLYLRAGIRYPRHVKDFEEAIPIILPELHRVRKLYVVFHSDSSVPQLIQQALSSSSLPRLELLHVNGAYNNVHLLGPKSFAGEVPRQLRNLALDFCALPPTCLVFQAPLTSLSISDCTIWTSMNALLDTLAGLPYLESFSLSVHSWASASPFETPPLSQLTAFDASKSLIMPRLKDISLCMQVESAIYLFTHISFPTSCSIVVDADLSNVELEDLEPHLYPALDNAFGQKLRAAFPEDDQSTGFCKLSLDVYQKSHEEGITIKCQDPTPNSGGPALFHLAFMPGHQLPDVEEFDTMSAIAYYVLEHWPATHCTVTQIIVDHPTIFSPSLPSIDEDINPWASVFTLFDNVERIVLAAGFEDIVDAFAGNVEDILLLPRLRHIEIERSKLSADDLSNIIRDLQVRTGPLETSVSTLKLTTCFLEGIDVPVMNAVIDPKQRDVKISVPHLDHSIIDA